MKLSRLTKLVTIDRCVEIFIVLTKSTDSEKMGDIGKKVYFFEDALVVGNLK